MPNLKSICPTGTCGKICGTLFSILLVVVIVWVAVGIRNDLREYDYIGQPTEERHEITITGEGKVTAIPDIASIAAKHQS